MRNMKPCPIETKCGDGCGKTIRKGEPTIQARGYWDGKKQTYYICEDCEYDRKQEEEREDRQY